MSNCLFCDIIEGNVPSRKVYEDDKVYAFMDISQTTPGHTLVVPKEHVRNLFEMSSETAAYLFSRVPKITQAIKASDDKVKGANILVNNEEVAYQSVFHSHVHIIPRYSSQDDFALKFTDNSEKYSDDQLDTIQARIQGQLQEGGQ